MTSDEMRDAMERSMREMDASENPFAAPFPAEFPSFIQISDALGEDQREFLRALDRVEYSSYRAFLVRIERFIAEPYWEPWGPDEVTPTKPRTFAEWQQHAAREIERARKDRR
jgi:hypothetical protein